MSLGNGAAPFRAWRWSEVPPEWQVPCSAADIRRAAEDMQVPESSIRSYVVVEVPDFLWAWRYQAWHSQASEGSRTDTDAIVPIMLVSRSDFRNDTPRTQEALYRQCLRDLLTTGRPSPLWSRVWAIEPRQEFRQLCRPTLSREKRRTRPRSYVLPSKL